MEAQMQRPSSSNPSRRKKRPTRRQVDDIPDIASPLGNGLSPLASTSSSVLLGTAIDSSSMHPVNDGPAVSQALSTSTAATTTTSHANSLSSPTQQLHLQTQMPSVQLSLAGSQSASLDVCADTDSLWDNLHRSGDSALMARLASSTLYPTTDATIMHASLDGVERQHAVSVDALAKPYSRTASQSITGRSPVSMLYPAAPLIIASAPPMAAQSFYPPCTLAPSAPSFDILHGPDPSILDSVSRQISSEQSVLDSASRNILMTAEYQEHTVLVQEFRSRNSRLSVSDPFYEKVLLYETAFKNTVRVRSQLSAARLSAKNMAGRLWTLTRTPKNASSVCSDEQLVSHTYTDEEATYDSAIEQGLVLAWNDARTLYNSHLNKALFETKMSKIWIQNTLDTFLETHFKASLSMIQTHPFSFVQDWEEINGTDRDIRQLLTYLDVLFLFERHGVPTLYSGSSPLLVPLRPHTSRGDKPSPTYPQSAVAVDDEPSLFRKDLRSWISYVAAVVIRLGGPSAHREILLHAIRCPGIGNWGAYLIQWPLPKKWTSIWIKQYLVSLCTFVGAIEELEETEAQKASDVAYVNASLRRLEVEDEWVVIDQHLFSPPSPRTVVFLREDDYMRILSQFNLFSMFESLMFHCLVEHSTAISIPHMQHASPEPMPFSLVFFFSNEVMSAFKRSITLLPNTYRLFLRCFCEAIVLFSCTMAKHLPLSASLETRRDFHPTTLQQPHAPNPSIQAEFDEFVFRLACVLLENCQLGLWECLLRIPFESVSLNMRRRIFSSAISGELYTKNQSNNSDLLCPLSIVLLSNPTQAEFFFQFLVALLCGALSVSKTAATNGSDRSLLVYTDDHLVIADVSRLITMVFDSCLLPHAIQSAMLDPVTSCLSTISARFPSSMSHILTATWMGFSKLETIAEHIFSSLPLERYPLNSSDLDILQSLLNDPIGSSRFKFAQFVISRIGWNSLQDHGSVLISQRHQRVFAIYLVHRAIDIQSSKENMTGIVSTTTAVAFATVEQVSKQILLPSNIKLFTDLKGDFLTWCWKIIRTLNIYQPPELPDVYLTSTYDRPYEPLDSPLMSSLLAHSKYDALAAFVLMLVSDIGHHYSQFELHGWSLLAIILEKGPIHSFLQASYLVMRLFVANKAVTLLETAEFGKLFKGVYRTAVAADPISLRDSNNTIGRFIVSTLREATDSGAQETHAKFAAEFWLQTVFVDKEWSHCPSALAVLDLVCEFYIVAGKSHILHKVFTGEYHTLLAVYHKNQSNSFKFSYSHPVESIYSLANTIEYLGSIYPTLVPTTVQTNSLGITLGGIVNKDKVAYGWLIYEALFVESLSERPSFQQIGRVLSNDLKMTVQQAVLSCRNDTGGNLGHEKPVESYSIFRWAMQILQLPLDHVAMPLFLQSFFSLYFERPLSGQTHASFGNRFLPPSHSYLQRLPELLDRLCSAKELSHGTHDREMLRIYRAMRLWLKEPRICSVGLSLFSDNEPFLIDRLRECNVFDGVKSTPSWVWLISKSSLQKAPASSSFTGVTVDLISPAPISFGDLVVGNGEDTYSGGAEPHLAMATHSTVTTISGLGYSIASAPPLVFRIPLIPPNHTLTQKSVMGIFEKELKEIMDASHIYISHASRLEESQKLCLENLRQLYTINKRLIRVERTCSSRCTGHAIIQCHLQEAEINVGMRNSASDFAQQADLVLLTDYLDAKLCISGLKILGVIDWLSHFPGQPIKADDDSHSASTSDYSRILESIFFGVVESLGSVSVYAPAAFLADIAVRQLGENVAALSEHQTIRIFDLLQKENMPSLLGKLFNPCRTPDNFPRFYGTLAKTLNGANLQPIFKSFDLQFWLKQSTPTRTHLQKKELFHVILEACEKDTDGGLHDAMMVQLFLLEQPGIWLDCIPLLIESTIMRKVGHDSINGILEHLLKTIQTEEDLNDRFDQFLASASLVLIDLTRESLKDLTTALISCFNKSISSSIFMDSNSTGIFQPLKFSCLLVFSEPFQSICSPVHFIDAYETIMSFFAPYMTLERQHDIVSPQEPRYRMLHNWTSDEEPFVHIILSLFFRAISKLCNIYSSTEQYLPLIWRFYSEVLESGANTVFLRTLEAFALKNDWGSYTIQLAMVGRVKKWLLLDSFSNESIGFVAKVLRLSIKSPTLASNLLLWQVTLSILHRGDSIWPVDAERTDAFQGLVHWITVHSDSHFLTAEDYSELIRGFPLEWAKQTTTTLLTDKTSHSSLTLGLMLLRELGGFGDSLVTGASSNLRTYISLVCTLVETQVKAEQLPAILGTTKLNFASDSIGGIIHETLRFAEVVSAPKISHSTSDQPLFHSVQCVISLLNICNRESKIFPKLWGGFILAARGSDHPMVYLMAACHSMSSIEHMAMIAELTISKHVSLNGDPEQWNVISNILQIPELDETTFIRHCLNHALAFTLYAHSFKQLSEHSSNIEQKIMMGERLGVWIESIRVEHVDQAQECLELSTLLLPANHSRLRAHLPLVSDALFRWSEDRSNQGIWATLGFGPVSRLSVEFRFCSRLFALFVSIRLIDSDADEQRAKLMDTFARMQQSSEYNKLGNLMDEANTLLSDTAIDLSALSSIVDKFTRKLFPLWGSLTTLPHSQPSNDQGIP
ncbi:hypothetical protein BASA62_000881 [Batrachochytrium salamandrivorans]|nr:hypothetical protein BASA62_000881 [Batrachochytrium salamandrivorans]